MTQRESCWEKEGAMLGIKVFCVRNQKEFRKFCQEDGLR